MIEGKPQFNAFFFDMDGTLINFGGFDYQYEAIKRWFRGHGCSEEQVESIARSENREERLLRMGITEEYYEKEILPKFPPIDFEMREEWFAEGKLQLNDGARELLKNIKQPKAIISQAPSASVLWVLDKFGIKKHFKYIHCRTFTPGDLRKPQKELAEKVAAALGVKIGPSIAVVGDGRRDAKFCENCNMTFLNVFKKVGEPEYFFKDLIELGKWLKSGG